MVPTLTTCTSTARTSILPTAAIGTAAGPSAAWSWQFYPNTEDKGFVYSPLFFVRGGDIGTRTLYYAGHDGFYWSSTVESNTNARYLRFDSGSSTTQRNDHRDYGFSLRCLAHYTPRQRPRTICCSFILQPGGKCKLGYLESLRLRWKFLV